MPGLRATLAAVVILAGCQSSKSAPADPETRGAGTFAEPAASAETAPAHAGGKAPGARLQDYRPPPEGAPAPAAEGSESDSEPAPARDLSAELRERIGDPSSCLSSADLPNEVTLTVDATVTGTGVITRTYVRGGVPDEALACVRRRLETARLRGPVDGAPRTVTTTLTLRRREPAKAPEPAP